MADQEGVFIYRYRPPGSYSGISCIPAPRQARSYVSFIDENGSPDGLYASGPPTLRQTAIYDVGDICPIGGFDFHFQGSGLDKSFSFSRVSYITGYNGAIGTHAAAYGGLEDTGGEHGMLGGTAVPDDSLLILRGNLISNAFIHSMRIERYPSYIVPHNYALCYNPVFAYNGASDNSYTTEEGEVNNAVAPSQFGIDYLPQGVAASWRFFLNTAHGVAIPPYLEETVLYGYTSGTSGDPISGLNSGLWLDASVSLYLPHDSHSLPVSSENKATWHVDVTLAENHEINSLGDVNNAELIRMSGLLENPLSNSASLAGLDGGSVSLLLNTEPDSRVFPIDFTVTVN